MTAISLEASVNINEDANDDGAEQKSKITTPSPLFLTPYHSNIINTFSWMSELIKRCCEEVMSVNLCDLEKLMKFYYTKVIESVDECYSEPFRAKKLKDSMSEVLIFFHMSYSELKPSLELSQFRAIMSDLMALYLDMEIEASRSGTDSLQNIASKLTSCLFIYFGSSYSHIIDTILKTKMINKDSWELSDLIFRRVLRDTPGSSINMITYMRYLLAFKLWKEIMGSAEKRKNIQLKAEQQLISPANFKEKLYWYSVLRDIFPRIPESETDITRFLLEAKYITRDKIEMFLKAVDDPRLQCISDNTNYVSCNYSYFSNEKDGFMNNWSNMNLEIDIEDSFMFKKIKNCPDIKKINMLKQGLRSDCKSQLKKKRKNSEKYLENVMDDDDKSFTVVETEEMENKDNIYEIDSVWESRTLDLAADVELPPSPEDVTDIPTIKLESQPSQSKEDIAYPWDIPNTHSHQTYNDSDSNSEFIFEKNTKQNNIFNLHDKHKFCVINEQELETCSSVGDQSSMQGLGLVPSEQLLIDSKSSDVQRNQDFINEKCHYPFKAINIPFENHNSEVIFEEGNEEISSEEFNEEIYSNLLNVECMNQRALEEHNGGFHSEEGITERTFDFSNDERSEHSKQTPPEKRGLVHDFTLKNDNKIYKFQVKLSSYWEKLNRCTWISILFPLFSKQDIKTPRCTCYLCIQNYNIIMKNWKSAVTDLSRLPRDVSNMDVLSGNFDINILEEMRESLESDGLKLLVWEPEMDEVYTKIEELIKEENKLSNLPLKKRKAFSYNKYVEEEKSEISYPNTPMISIAELELTKENFRFNEINMNQSSICNDEPLNYMSDFISHPGLSNLSNIKHDVIVQSNISHISSEQNLFPSTFMTPFVPEHHEQNRSRFKTPAQLKQFQHFSRAQVLINFSHSSHTSYYHENQETRKDDESDKIKTKCKIKSSRKRKRTI